MSVYWDSGAIVAALCDEDLRARMSGGVTRPHALAEVFAVLTGGRTGRKFAADAVAQMLDEVRTEVSFVELSPEEMVNGMRRAKKRAVMGGRIHDLMHGLASDKAGAETFITTDRNDFNGLTSARIEILKDIPGQAATG